MNRLMIIFWLVLSLVFFTYPAYGLMKMDDSGIKDALQYGNTHKLEEIANSPEWNVKEKDGTEATFLTPYNMVAVRAAKAKMEGREFTFQEAKDMFKSPEQGTLGMLDVFLFYCWVYGPTEDYLKEFTFELRQGTTIVKVNEAEMEQPTFVNRDGKSLYYVHYRLYFSNTRIDIKSPVTLVVTNPMGKEWQYGFDLKKIR